MESVVSPTHELLLCFPVGAYPFHYITSYPSLWPTPVVCMAPINSTCTSCQCTSLQLMTLYAIEAEELVTHLSASGVTDSKVTDYCTELTTHTAQYKRVSELVAV